MMVRQRTGFDDNVRKCLSDASGSTVTLAN